MIIVGILLIVSLFLFGIGIYLIYAKRSEVYGFILLILATGLATITWIITHENTPTKQDVLDGKAVYQETIHITNNDTIKTYEIVWKLENF